MGVCHSVRNHLVVQVTQVSGNLLRAKVAAKKFLAEHLTTYLRPDPNYNLRRCGAASDVVACNVVALLGQLGQLSRFLCSLKYRGDVVI